jgi:soluble lytic murein transglycosylase
MTRIARLLCRTIFAFSAGFLIQCAALPAKADETTSLRTALDRAAFEDWDNAAAAAEGQLSKDVIEWMRLRAGSGKLGDFEAFLARHPDWPGLLLLRKKGEEAVARSTDPNRVLAYFADDLPRAPAGSLALVKAYLALGRAADAETESIRAWTELEFTAPEEDALLALMPEALSVAHEVRLDRVLWADRAPEAKRMLPRVGKDWRALATARLALRAMDANAPTLVDAVPKSLAGDAGLAFERFTWRMKKDRTADATALILDRSKSAASLGDPAAWADGRANLARALMRAGEPRNAYKVAARNQMNAGQDYADLEFLAGFIALRKLNDPETALKHFANLKAAVATPISLARADYWLGRALSAKGDQAGAKAAYTKAAKNQTAYYGLLAAERLGLTLDANLLADSRPDDWRNASFAGSSVFQAARLLVRAGDRGLGKRFLLQLAEGKPAAELAQLADYALEADEPHIAVLIAKQAAEAGIILPRAYFPLTDLVPDNLPVSRALALSIARRESEFDAAVISPAGARGLMQVMPGTAKQIAPTAGLPYEPGKLTSDPAYNVTLGSTYLRKLIDEFGPSVALVASGYNAGPGRPRRWVTQFGDPRRSDVDVVDWVETIPFTETRTYVMRVSESVVIYRAKLKGAVGPVRITSELTGN